MLPIQNRIMATNEFLKEIAYAGGFKPDDIVMQAERGLVVNKKGHSNFNTNAVLPIGAATEMDKIVMQAVHAEPRIYMDLVAAGCVKRQSFGTYISTYSQQNLADAPNISMDMKYQDKFSNKMQSQSDFKNVAIPVPCVWYDFDISAREIAAANNTSSMFGGLALENLELSVKSLGLASALDDICWNGSPQIILNDQPLTGILNNPIVVSQALPLTFSKSEPDAFIGDFLLQAIQPLVNKNYMGKFMVYYSSNAQFVFESDYLNQYPTQTLVNRLLKIKRVQDVRDTPWLNPSATPFSQTSAQIVVIKMDPSAIDVVVESEIRVAQYASYPHLSKYLMFAALAPRVKVDYYGKVGIQLINLTITD